MIDLLATIFITPLSCDRRLGMLLALPLCLAISTVYKTMKCRTIAEIPGAVLVSWITILVGMAAVGVALLAIFKLAA
jgi:hypothetical protein